MVAKVKVGNSKCVTVVFFYGDGIVCCCGWVVECCDVYGDGVGCLTVFCAVVNGEVEVGITCAVGICVWCEC